MRTTYKKKMFVYADPIWHGMCCGTFFNYIYKKGRKHKMAQKIVYNHKAVEKKWRENWEKNPVNPQFDDNGNKKQKYYCLDMFPYP